MNNLAIAPLGCIQENDLSERQAARAIGVTISDFRQAQCSRVLPPATWQDTDGKRYWSRASVRAVVDLYSAMTKGRDVQHAAMKRK